MAREEVPIATFCWRRRDRAGHDSCRLLRCGGDWRLRGGAAFLEEGRPSHLAYEVTCDAAWRSKAARVAGHVGARAVDLRISRSRAGWRVGGVRAPALEDCVDIDLGFTPATNLLPIRRLALPVGESAASPAAWLDMRTLRFDVLPQTYRRVSARRYRYSAPTIGYAGTLDVSRLGAIVRYPRLFDSLS